MRHVEIGTARGICRDLHPRGVELAVGDVEVTGRIVERRLAYVALRPEVAVALELLAREALVGLGLDECLLRCGQAGLAQLPELGLALRNRGFRLRDRCAFVAIVELDQHVAPAALFGPLRPEFARPLQ